MASTDFKIISDFLEGKSRQLWEHEQRMGFNRTFAKLRLDESHFSKIEISGRRFFIVSTRVFREILSGVLSQACEAYPHQFGSGRAEDVISALYKVESIGTPTGQIQYSIITDLRPDFKTIFDGGRSRMGFRLRR